MQTYTHWTALARGAWRLGGDGQFRRVHLGHQSVIDLARGREPLGIITFEPHPREVFAPDAAPFRLMNAEAREHRLAKLGVERLYELPFNRDLAGMDPETFAREVLAEGLGVAHVTVGGDFRFGKGRAAGTTELIALGRELGFDVTVAPLLHIDGIEVLDQHPQGAGRGRVRDAAKMLGHLHRIEGEVMHGDKRGRDLGFPTANMSVARLHLPKLGVYAVKVDVLTGPHAGAYLGAASLGVRPMFGENAPNLETFLFDFEGDLYGQHLSVALVDYLRPEMKFDGLPALMKQMAADCETAREILRSA
ncbi:riboflavin biosynthesis protein RibF [Rhodobacter capsulatus]|uniref:riboflavin biosynthesis protein RibF n=1 Tax=Rhodobacter capsulatus TaxID=1061 RepID=UPI0040269729